MTDRKYFSGNSLEQAVMNAARHFKIDPDDLDYRQLDKRHGFVKVRRSHLIEVDPNSPRKPLSDDEAYKRAMNMDPEAHLGRDPNDRSYVTDTGSDRGGRSRRRKGRQRKSQEGRQRKSQQAKRRSQQDGDHKKEQSRSPEADAPDRNDRDDARRRQQRGRRGDGRKRAADGNARQPQAATAPPREQQERDRGSSDGQRRRVMRPAGRGGRQAAEGPPADAALKGAAALLHLGALDLTADAYQGDDHLEIELSGSDEDRVTRRRGEVLAALQQLVPSIVRSQTGERVFCRVDCDGFREVHEERLRDLAQRVAGKVGRNGRAQVLESMNPAERRIIHMTLNDDPAVSTESLGKGYFKRVRISPE